MLAVAAALAAGPTEIRDAAELRVKESDRIAAIARELGRMGVRVEERPDGYGGGGRTTPFAGPRGRAAVTIAWPWRSWWPGLVADGETVVEDTACIATSFPSFVDTLNALAGGDAVTVEA